MWPDPSLLPPDPGARAKVIAAAHTIAVDVQPVNNLGVLQALQGQFDADQAALKAWMERVMTKGFRAYETLVRPGPYSFGDQPTLADICLVPQLYNAHRCGIDLAPYLQIAAIEEACLALPAFDAARFENQPDAET